MAQVGLGRNFVYDRPTDTWVPEEAPGSSGGGPSEQTLQEVVNNTDLFRVVDGDSVAFTDSADGAIGPLAAGRVWVKVIGGNAHVVIGVTPAPTATNMPITDGADYYFKVEAGDSVGVIGMAGQSGDLYVATETAIP